MRYQTNLPAKINNITVCANQAELGVLTYGSVHHYQPLQEKQHVSLTMTQKGMDGYSSSPLHPIFAQNLPEGFNRRLITEKLTRYAKVNDMYLLALQGDQSVGILSYKSELNSPVSESLNLSDILSYRSKEPLFTQLLDKYYLKTSLAGMQPKVSIPNANTVQTDRAVPQKDLIVKSFDAEFPLLTVNEFVCMQAARHCGLEPPKTYLSENLETYVVERFDRSSDGTKLGYEDFTTLMKKSNGPNAKYTSSYETLLKATYLYTSSVAEVEKMYKYIVFNCLIGNGDAHLKNFALQYSPDMKNIFVSPPFDLTHTLIYESIDHKMVLKLAGSKAFPDRSHLIKLAESDRFRIRNPKAIIEFLSENILDYLRTSNEVQLFDGLRTSIERSISNVMATGLGTQNYRLD
ncbi:MULTISPECIES: type II toxin-antitoxin system HipA family toxin [Acinetobacter]|uniref:Type II toxin-antitoxin system HipA family toxin n=1 Tax=Acinetobacter ursingii TaxID=108980 RepID=A0AA46S6G6_9GAMM|nr:MULTISPECIES: type II toxin-antitoxin system HipA family toxin [Acinetobacter]EXD30388.1 hipA-like N-terminal domain protein [Acinetobacter sp. 479375]UYF73678.1 type II toxin-antitoxin system HipA family toxin [Acinetobacter ursingii]